MQEEGLTAEGLDVLAIFAVPFGIGAFEGVVWHQPRALRTAGTRLLPLLLPSYYPPTTLLPPSYPSHPSYPSYQVRCWSAWPLLSTRI